MTTASEYFLGLYLRHLCGTNYFTQYAQAYSAKRVQKTYAADSGSAFVIFSTILLPRLASFFMPN